jgi:hypothetical protein
MPYADDLRLGDKVKCIVVTLPTIRDPVQGHTKDCAEPNAWRKKGQCPIRSQGEYNATFPKTNSSAGVTGRPNVSNIEQA